MLPASSTPEMRGPKTAAGKPRTGQPAALRMCACDGPVTDGLRPLCLSFWQPHWRVPRDVVRTLGARRSGVCPHVRALRAVWGAAPAPAPQALQVGAQLYPPPRYNPRKHGSTPRPYPIARGQQLPCGETGSALLFRCPNVMQCGARSHEVHLRGARGVLHLYLLPVRAGGCILPSYLRHALPC